MKRIQALLMAFALIACTVGAIQLGTISAEAVTVSNQEYEVFYTGRHSSFLCNKVTVGNEVGTEYFLTYTVESVTSSGSQNGFLGTSDPESQFPYTKGSGLLYYQQRKSDKETPELLMEGYTYFVKFTVTESGYRYVAARAKGNSSEYFVIEGKAADGKSNGKNYGYFGLWFGDGVTEAHLTNVRFYDVNGKDLGVWSPRSLANVVKCNEVKADTQVDHSYTVTAADMVNLAISNEKPLTTDRMYIEYTVVEAESTATQSGIALSNYPQNTYPHSNGMLKYESLAAEQSSFLLQSGAKYIIVLEKGKYGFTAYAQITKDGKFVTKVFPLVSGSYVEDAQYFSLWFGTGQDCKTSFILEDVKIYDGNKENLGVQSNNSDVRIRHFGAVLDYAACEAVYYCHTSGASYTLYEDQTLIYEANGTKTEGTYTVRDNQITISLGEDSQTYDYLYSGFTAQDEQAFKRLYSYQVKFVAGNGTEDIVQVMDMEKGYKAVKPADPTLSGCSFEGWCTSDGTAYEFGTMVTKSTTLYAKWTNGAGVTYLANEDAPAANENQVDVLVIVICALIVLAAVAGSVWIIKGGMKRGTDVKPEE